MRIHAIEYYREYFIAVTALSWYNARDKVFSLFCIHVTMYIHTHTHVQIGCLQVREHMTTKETSFQL